MKAHDSGSGDPSAGVQTTKEGFAYPGRELEAMAQAANYHRWILDTFKPYLGRNLVEVGAGIGSFSELILKLHQCETLSLVEPSNAMYGELAARAQQLKTSTKVRAYHSTFIEAAPQIKLQQLPDSIIYVNVLEHVADDERELKAIHQTLADAGRVFLFVPALSWLYGAFDERVGHFRRYSKRELEEKLGRTGFKVILSTYFDFAGIAPWWLKYCLLKSVTMNPGGVRFYDRFIVPAARRVESIVSPPLGKNIIAIAEKRRMGRNQDPQKP
ncbi:MAG: class I SAM-dependent methyltransferase [Acidobacteria bacterium]|nr:class I SAM-dependent methyltransferase [Acidobacteriota bacterium]